MFHENFTHAKKKLFTVLPICNISHESVCSNHENLPRWQCSECMTMFSLLNSRLLVRHLGLYITNDFVAVGGGEYRLQDRGRKGERPYLYTRICKTSISLRYM